MSVAAEQTRASCTDLSVRTWQALEAKRYRSLRLPSRYSRHFNVTRDVKGAPMKEEQPRPSPPAPSPPVALKSQMPTFSRSQTDLEKKNNSIAPFITEQKPTCGYYFSRETDNKKRNFGVAPTDLVKYRYFSGGNQ